MAGLPSVVLGFLAALVIAPLVEGAVASIVAAFLLLPIAFLLGAYLWQLLPSHVGLRLEGWPRFACLLATLLLAVLVATWLGPVVERVLFARNIVDWLNGNRGSGAGGWFLLFLPIFALLAALAMGRWVRPWLRSTTRGWTRRATALADIGRFAAGGLVVVLVAYGVATLVAAMGVDPRGSVPQGGVGIVGTYVQRNALIVGFVMGFAIIPIIYTLAEDALSSVPFHLREGSLGAGATRWQTAVRIIVPTAMSGLFSACMIGMGRAVGETMIVLMAAGNTPLMDLNVFNGFRTLSANVAVELPEAVVGDSHYRTLFLNGLVLFAMTFVVNTIAETVRLRFRRMAFHL
jgi:phosphate transport system permease protein